jgi:RHS repeat-associated protein
MTDPLERTLAFAYDASNRVVAQTLPDGRVVGFGYDAANNLTSLTPPSRPPHAFAYTPVNLAEEYAPPDIGLETTDTTYLYNLDRQLTRVLRPDGREVTIAYDPAGRRESVTFSRGVQTYEYSPEGRLESITTPEGNTLTYTYDGPLLRTTTWSGEVSGSVERTYDASFRVNSITVNGANPVPFTYDNDDLLIGAGALLITRSPQTGLITGTTLGQVTTSNTYNAFGEVVGFSSFFGTTPLFSYTLTRDKLGRIVEKTETIGGVTDMYTYGYDLAGRLTDVVKNGVSISHYEYDANGNRISHTTPTETVAAIYDAQDRLLQYGDTAYAYTAAGDLASKTQGGHSVVFGYDEMGNLRTAELPDGITVNYIIDGNNRRIAKRVNGNLVGGLLFGGRLRPVAEQDGAGSVVARFVHGDRPNVPEHLIKAGVSYRVLTDNLGTPRLIINSQTGGVVQRMDFDEFGRVEFDTNPGFQPFGFAGGLYDHQSGLVRLGSRDYDARTGRWTNPDPMRFIGGSPNLYSYVLGDPVNLIDPHGRYAVAAVPLLAVGAAAVLATAAIVTSPGYQDWANHKIHDLQDWWADWSRRPLEPVEPAEYRGPWDPPVAPGRACPQPTPIPGQKPKTTPPPAVEPADPEEHQPPSGEDLWGDKEKEGLLDKIGDALDWLFGFGGL